ncbi:MAG: serine hydrolase domain-containing protein [Actinomycetota bacterium]
MTIADLVGRARRDVEEGLVPSCQLAVARHGELIAFATLGAATKEDRYTIFSVTKALVASAVWRLVGDGLLRYEQRVSELVPEFATNGKEHVTVEQLLLHTSGFARAPMRPEEGATSTGRVARFATWRIDHEPGTETEYHPTAAHWVLAELVERATGADYRPFVNETAGDALTLGHAEALDVVIVGDPTTIGKVDPGTGETFDVPEIEGDLLLRYNEPEVRAAGVPGAGATGTAADVALFFQSLLRNPDGRWDPAVLTDATGVVRNTYPDPYTRVSASRTRGLVLAGDDGFESLRGFGPGVSAKAFASPGLGGQTAWADPASGLSFAFLTNGIDADLVRAFRRGISLSKLAAELATG